MPDPLPTFNQSIITNNSTIIVGLSGGPDSIYLLYQLKSLIQTHNITIIAVHLDHEWQESSKKAVQLCQETCQLLNIQLIVKKISDLAYDIQWNGSQEEIGRKMRRHLFESIAKKYQASAIALAHHQQDQQETFFIRLIRGSSLKGLTGIREIDGLYIRPMLTCNKPDILNYLHSHHIHYYIDQTNASNEYLRNRIRNILIPSLQKIDERFEKNLTSTMNYLGHVDDFIEKHTQEILAKISTSYGIEIKPFFLLHKVIQQRIILIVLIEQKIIFTPSQKLFKEIMRFLEKSSKNNHTIGQTCSIQKNKSFFTVKHIKKIDKNL